MPDFNPKSKWTQETAPDFIPDSEVVKWTQDSAPDFIPDSDVQDRSLDSLKEEHERNLLNQIQEDERGLLGGQTSPVRKMRSPVNPNLTMDDVARGQDLSNAGKIIKGATWDTLKGMATYPYAVAKKLVTAPSANLGGVVPIYKEDMGKAIQSFSEVPSQPTILGKISKIGEGLQSGFESVPGGEIATAPSQAISNIVYGTPEEIGQGISTLGLMAKGPKAAVESVQRGLPPYKLNRAAGHINMFKNRFAKSVSETIDPTEARNFKQSIEEGTPFINKYLEEHPTEVTSMKKASSVLNAVKDDFWRNHVDEIATPIKTYKVSGKPIADAVRASAEENVLTKTTNPKMINQTLNFAEAFNRPFTIEELSTLRSNLNDACNYFQKRDNIDKSTMLGDPKTAKLVSALQATRDTLNKAIDQYGQQESGYAAGAMRTFYHLKNLSDITYKAEAPLDFASMVDKGTLFSPTEYATKLLQAETRRRGQYIVAHELARTATKGRNAPDKAISGAFWHLQKGREAVARVRPVQPKSPVEPTTPDITPSTTPIQPAGSANPLPKGWEMLGQASDKSGGKGIAYRNIETGRVIITPRGYSLQDWLSRGGFSPIPTSIK